MSTTIIPRSRSSAANLSLSILWDRESGIQPQMLNRMGRTCVASHPGTVMAGLPDPQSSHPSDFTKLWINVISGHRPDRSYTAIGYSHTTGCERPSQSPIGR